MDHTPPGVSTTRYKSGRLQNYMGGNAVGESVNFCAQDLNDSMVVETKRCDANIAVRQTA